MLNHLLLCCWCPVSQTTGEERAKLCGCCWRKMSAVTMKQMSGHRCTEMQCDVFQNLARIQPVTTIIYHQQNWGENDFIIWQTGLLFRQKISQTVIFFILHLNATAPLRFFICKPQMLFGQSRWPCTNLSCHSPLSHSVAVSALLFGSTHQIFIIKP